MTGLASFHGDMWGSRSHRVSRVADIRLGPGWGGVRVKDGDEFVG